MNFDPAIAAQASFKHTIAQGELGEDAGAAIETEEVFSSNAGEVAKSAYQGLQSLGERHPDAAHFQEFLIYITWQQVTEETLPVHFERGLKLCQRYLARFADAAQVQAVSVRQVRALQESFRSGLGLTDDDEHQQEYDRDAFMGGD